MINHTIPTKQHDTFFWRYTTPPPPPPPIGLVWGVTAWEGGSQGQKSTAFFCHLSKVEEVDQTYFRHFESKWQCTSRHRTFFPTLSFKAQGRSSGVDVCRSSVVLVLWSVSPPVTRKTRVRFPAGRTFIFYSTSTCHYFRLVVLFRWMAKKSARANGACAHSVMVSKFQWKPLWLATQRDPQNDWTATQNRVNYDVLAQAPLQISHKLIWCSFFFFFLSISFSYQSHFHYMQYLFFFSFFSFLLVLQQSWSPCYLCCNYCL